MEKGYIRSFQGIRVFAAILVFISHSRGLLKIGNFSIGGPGYGAFAVTLFFMLSGFLTQRKFDTRRQERTRSLLSECRANLIRGLKAYMPLHLLMVALSMIISYKIFLTSPGKACLGLFLQIFLLQSWCPDRSVYCIFNDVSWYLSALIFLVAISPILTRLVSRWKGYRSSLLLIALIGIQIGMAFAYQGLSNVLWNGKETESFQASLGYWLVYIFPPARLADYVAGCALYYAVESLRENLPSPLCCVMLLISLILGGLTLYLCGRSNNQRVFDDALWLLPSMGILFSCACGDEKSKLMRNILGNPLACLLGGITFEFFLLHTFILRLGIAGYNIILGIKPNLSTALLAIMATFFLSFGINRLSRLTEKRQRKTNS